MSFWMQMGHTGISAIFMIHLAAAIKNASMSHVSLYRLLENDLIVEPLVVSDGYAKAPAKPGLGVEIDEDAEDKNLHGQRGEMFQKLAGQLSPIGIWRKPCENWRKMGRIRSIEAKSQNV